MNRKLYLGQLVATPGALELLAKYKKDIGYFIRRHASEDWGDLCEEDQWVNAISLDTHGRVMSVYHLDGGGKIWIITEGDRSATTVLLPDEY